MSVLRWSLCKSSDTATMVQLIAKFLTIANECPITVRQL